MDADVADMVKYTVAGIAVNDLTMSVDIIKDVGYAKNFLSHKDTFKNRNIQSQPKLIDRNMRGRWEDKGSTTMNERAKFLLDDIRQNYFAPDLSAEIRKQIRDIVNEAEDKCGVPLSKE